MGPLSGTATRLYVSLATIPGRERALPLVVGSLLRQSRPPDRLFVVAPELFTNREVLAAARHVNMTALLLHLPSDPRLEFITCPRDDGPSTKLLCALPRALAHLDAVSHGGEDTSEGARASFWLVLADDDRIYREWALATLESAILSRGATSDATHAAFSFYTKEVWLPRARGPCYGPCECGPEHRPSGCRGAHSCCTRQWLQSRLELSWPGLRYLPTGLPPTLIVGQGADLFALPLQRLRSAVTFYRCAIAADARLSRHDDYWVSAFLQLVANTSVLRAPSPAEMRATSAERTAAMTTLGAGSTPLDKMPQSGSQGHPRSNATARKARSRRTITSPTDIERVYLPTAKLQPYGSRARRHDESREMQLALHKSREWPSVLAACAFHWDTLADRCAVEALAVPLGDPSPPSSRAHAPPRPPAHPHPSLHPRPQPHPHSKPPVPPAPPLDVRRRSHGGGSGSATAQWRSPRDGGRRGPGVRLPPRRDARHDQQHATPCAAEHARLVSGERARRFANKYTRSLNQSALILDDGIAGAGVSSGNGETAPRIVVLSISIGRPWLANITQPRLRAYCTFHGYQLRLATGSFDATRHISWSRIPFLQQVMASEPTFDLYVWIDDDIYISSLHVPIAARLAPYQAQCGMQAAIALSQDAVTYTPFNAGVC